MFVFLYWEFMSVLDVYGPCGAQRTSGAVNFLCALLCQDSGLTLSNVMPAFQTQNT